MIRQVTAKFHDIDVAKAAGYELGYVNGAGTRIITGCVPTQRRASWAITSSTRPSSTTSSSNPQKPEGLVYTLQNGEYKLGAVEYVVPGAIFNPPACPRRRASSGSQMHILVPAVGFYLQHFWVWSHNPAGIFTDWNPKLSCP